VRAMPSINRWKRLATIGTMWQRAAISGKSGNVFQGTLRQHDYLRNSCHAMALRHHLKEPFVCTIICVTPDTQWLYASLFSQVRCGTRATKWLPAWQVWQCLSRNPPATRFFAERVPRRGFTPGKSGKKSGAPLPECQTCRGGHLLRPPTRRPRQSRQSAVPGRESPVMN
jgi:hypothetical protein